MRKLLSFERLAKRRRFDRLDVKAQLLSKTSPDGMAEEGILPQALAAFWICFQLFRGRC